MMVPSRLLNDGFRFCLISKGQKAPFEQRWQVENNYTYDDERLIKHIEYGNNYGVIGGYGNLLIIDFDNLDFQKEFLPKLPLTFTVKTGGGGLHLYYICDDCPSLKILDDKKETLADIQGRGKQVVAPGSTHPNGNKYEVVNDVPIEKIKLDSLRIIFSDYIKPEQRIKIKHDKDEMVSKIKNKLSITSILSGYGYDLSRNPTMCLLGHTSKSKKCFSFNEKNDLWYCHHCDGGGDIFSLVMAQEGCNFSEAKNKLMKIAGIKTEKNNNSNSADFTISELKNSIFEVIFDEKEKNKDDKISEMIVEFIKLNYKIHTIRHDEKEEVWIYSDGIYIPEGKTYVKELTRDILGPSYRGSRIMRILNKIIADTYIQANVFFTEEPPNLIAVSNGILNLKTRQLTKFSPKHKFFNKIPITWAPGAKCDKIIAFFSSVLKDPSDIDTIQELFGYLLYRNYEVEKAIMLTGNGRNGKSKTIELMKKFIGIKNCANIPIQALEKDNFAMGELFNKLANLSADISKTALQETGKFKSLIGRDLVSAPRKFLPMVHFQNYAKMIFSANELPITKDITPAFFLRWVIIDFPYTFVSEKEMNKINKNGEKTDGVRIANPNIIKEISPDDQMSGLLNWALGGLKRLLENGDFSYNKSGSEVKNTWLRKSSSIHAFIMDVVERKSDAKVPKQEFLEAYLDYCSKHMLTSVTEKEIKECLETTIGSIAYRPEIDGERIICWKGIMLLDK